MSTKDTASQRITNLLTQSDYFRCSPSRLGGPAEHKEWQHFIVHTDSMHLLINFSLVDEFYLKDGKNHEVARVIVMARTTHWDGDVERFEQADVAVTPGHLDARFGNNWMRFEDGRYILSVTLKNRPIRAELEMVPTTVPALSSNQPLSRTRNISWLFVPRLVCRGTVTIGDDVIHVENASGYHDHNWGRFKWDDDFSWEWGSALTIDNHNPWSIVYMRMCDRARTLCRSQALYIGYGDEQLRFFRDWELSVTLHHRLAQEKCLKVPRVMAMLAATSSRDLPAHLEVNARAGNDQVKMVFILEDLAQLLVPSETRIDGVTSINEISGVVTMTGVVKGEQVNTSGPGVFEFIRD